MSVSVCVFREPPKLSVLPTPLPGQFADAHNTIDEAFLCRNGYRKFLKSFDKAEFYATSFEFFVTVRVVSKRGKSFSDRLNQAILVCAGFLNMDKENVGRLWGKCGVKSTSFPHNNNILSTSYPQNPHPHNLPTFRQRSSKKLSMYQQIIFIPPTSKSTFYQHIQVLPTFHFGPCSHKNIRAKSLVQ